MGKKWTIFLLIFILINCTACVFVSAANEQHSPLLSTGGGLPVTLKIYTIDADTKLPVTGAEFVLSKEDDTYLSMNPRNEADGWVKSRDRADLLISDENGIISIGQILPGTYYLTESKTPNGYSLLEEPVKIRLSAIYASNFSAIKELSVQVNDAEPIRSTAHKQDLAEVTIEKTYGTVLPETGGVGTTIYYMLGVVALFAVALTIAAKRLAGQEA